MNFEVIYSDNADSILRVSESLLASDAVLHNVMLTLLQERVESPEPGHYWIAKERGKVVGVVAQSPPGLFATLSCMTTEIAARLVDAIATQGIVLPGINGEASAAATFAGQWSERLNAPAVPVKGLRIYVLQAIDGDSTANGQLRRARVSDRDTVLAFMRQFLAEIGEPPVGLESMVDRRLTVGLLWLWEDKNEPVSLVGCSEAVHGVVRIRVVYTPKERRNHGYGTAAARELSRVIGSRGDRCILYTDLGNPISNSIYRRIGYRAVAEALRYQFG